MEARMAFLAIVAAAAVAAAGSPGAAGDEARTLAAQCDAGKSTSCIHLGIMHRRGIDAPLDERKAIELFVSACEQGYTLACAFTGDMAFVGEGVARNAEHGEILMRRACSGKNEWACETLRRRGLIDPRAKALY
jgi:TPR repeat protein